MFLYLLYLGIHAIHLIPAPHSVRCSVGSAHLVCAWQHGVQLVDLSVLAGWGIMELGSCWFIWHVGVFVVGSGLDTIEGMGSAGMYI